MKGNESLRPSPEENREILKASHEAVESNKDRIRNRAEKAEKLDKNEARLEVDHALRGKEKEAVEQHEKAPRHNEKSRRPALISPSDKKIAFKTTMKRIQNNMPAPTRVFSKVIHNPIIDKVSDLSGKTIARPSGILGGGLSVVLGLGVSYYTARNTGFELSGSEFIWLLIVGFVLGLIIEWLVRAIKEAAHN